MSVGLRAALCLLLLSSFVSSLSACAPQPITVTREPVTLHIVASDSCAPMAESRAEAYEASRPWVTIDIEVFSTALADQVVREESADLAFLSWLWDSHEDGAAPLWTEEITREGIAVIVHPGSPVTDIGLAQLREIFRGRLQSWQGVTFTVVSREDGSGARAAFESIVLGGESTTLNAVVMPSSKAVIEYVASTPGAIGYVSTERLDDSVRVLPIEGVPPTEQTINDGQYALWQPLYLASSGDPRGEAREFAQWLLSGGRTSISGAAIDP